VFATRPCRRSSAQPVNAFDLVNGFIGEAVAPDGHLGDRRPRFFMVGMNSRSPLSSQSVRSDELVVLQTLRTFRQVLILPYVVNDIYWSIFLPTDWQTASAHHDRERINRARQDAEDLFKPKQQPTRAEVPTSAQK